MSNIDHCFEACFQFAFAFGKCKLTKLQSLFSLHVSRHWQCYWCEFISVSDCFRANLYFMKITNKHELGLRKKERKRVRNSSVNRLGWGSPNLRPWFSADNRWIVRSMQVGNKTLPKVKQFKYISASCSRVRGGQSRRSARESEQHCCDEKGT